VPNQKHIFVEKWHLIQNQPSLWQIFKEPPLISFKMGKPLSLAYESETFKRPMALDSGSCENVKFPWVCPAPQPWGLTLIGA